MGGANDITTKDSQLDGWEGLVMSIVAKVTFLKGEGIVEEKVCVFFFYRVPGKCILLRRYAI